MEPDPGHELHIALSFTSDEELDELERALLKARAAELSEVRRRQTRLITGYGDGTTRDVMDDEARRAQRRFDALNGLLDALRDARSRGGRAPRRRRVAPSRPR